MQNKQNSHPPIKLEKLILKGKKHFQEISNIDGKILVLIQRGAKMLYEQS